MYRARMRMALLVALSGGMLLRQSPATPASPAPLNTSIAEEARSRTGPLPPAGVAPKPRVPYLPRDAPAAAMAVVLDVPPFAYRHGCGPTTLGMIMAYYDTRGYPVLFPGEATHQTESVNQAIASTRPSGPPGHYEDYALPLDESGRILRDKSESPRGDEHAHDSLADFSRTSWSAAGNCYGWTLAADMAPACSNYVRWRESAYHVECINLHVSYGNLTWAVLTREIDAGRPMILLTDSDADGTDDHFVTAVGYRTSPRNQYACYDTWPPADVLRWADVAPVRKGQPWGISHGWTIRFTPRPTPAVLCTVDVTNTTLAITITDLCFGAMACLQTATNLCRPDWQNCVQFTAQTAATNLTQALPPHQGPRYYRVRCW